MNISQYLELWARQMSHGKIQIVGPFFDESSKLQEPLIFVDAGVRFRIGAIGFSAGDGDSTSIPMDEELNPTKDFSDLSFVLKNLPQHFCDIQLLGFLGHRNDHQLMNWAEAHRVLKSRTVQPTKIQFDQSVFAVSQGNWKLNIHGLFSLFSFEETELILNGACEYLVTAGQKFQPRSSQGLSNVGHGDIQMKVSEPIFIFTESPLLLSDT